MIEFALLMPLLLTVLLGIAEFGWALSINLDVRHGAREGARLAAVDAFSGSEAAMAAETCSRMDIPTGQTVTFSGGGDTGNTSTVTVSWPYDSLTGWFDSVFTITDLTTTVDTRQEQDAPAWSGTAISC